MWAIKARMTQADRDRLIVETHTSVQVLESYVIGNGTPGLVKQVAALQAFRYRILGALTLLSVIAGLVTIKLGS